MRVHREHVPKCVVVNPGCSETAAGLAILFDFGILHHRMHGFMVFCTLVEAVAILVLAWRTRHLSQGADATSEQSDKIIEELGEHTGALDSIRERIPHGLTETNWSEVIAKLYEHTEALIAISKRGESTDRALDLFIEASQIRMAEAESKISDLSEGCAKLDADLSTASEDIRECVELRQSDLAGLNERITQIADDQEKARRKSGLRGAPAAWESIRAVAESSARKTDKFHDDLVAAATGPDS